MTLSKDETKELPAYCTLEVPKYFEELYCKFCNKYGVVTREDRGRGRCKRYFTASEERLSQEIIERIMER